MTVREWDAIFSSRPWGRWPDTRFVEWAMRTFGDARRKDVKFLELGSGAGAQLRFLAGEGFDAYGVEGSAAAVRQSKELLWDTAVVWHMDLEYLVGKPGLGAFADETYDCIVDVCTLQHLGAGLNAQVIQRAHQMLKPGGWIFSKYAAFDKAAYHWPSKDVPAPSPLWESDIPHVFPGFSRQVNLEIVRNMAGPELRHWIITGRKV